MGLRACPNCSASARAISALRSQVRRLKKLVAKQKRYRAFNPYLQRTQRSSPAVDQGATRQVDWAIPQLGPINPPIPFFNLDAPASEAVRPSAPAGPPGSYTGRFYRDSFRPAEPLTINLGDCYAASEGVVILEGFRDNNPHLPIWSAIQQVHAVANWSEAVAFAVEDNVIRLAPNEIIPAQFYRYSPEGWMPTTLV